VRASLPLAPSRTREGGSAARALGSLLVVIAGCSGTGETAADGGAPTPIDRDAGQAIDGARSAPDGAAGDCEGYDFAALDAALDALVADGTAPGVAFTIVRRGCGVLYERGAGTFTTETVVPIASASKVPSMMLLMTLVDDGLIDLDATVESYLGDDWPDDKSTITVRHLMSHLAGLTSMVPCLGDRSSTLDACGAAIAATPLAGAPGHDFIYGGADYQVAGWIAERVTGRTYNDLFAERIAEPCDLSTFTFAASADNSLGSDTNPRVAGGAATDVRDYGRLLLMHLEGGTCDGAPVLSSAALEEMTRDQTAGATIVGSPYPDGRGYGFGWWREPSATGEPYVFSDGGAFGAKPWIDPARGYGAMLLIRRTAVVGERIYATLLPVVERAIDRR
jgi:CubicO group peptidase (beta-lactamase class C family)